MAAIDKLAVRLGVLITNEFQEPIITVCGGINVVGLYVDAVYLLNEMLRNTLMLSTEFALGRLRSEDEPVEEVGVE